MKHKNFIRFSLLLFLTACSGLFIQCSKDDGNDGEQGEIITSATVQQAQVVEIEMPQPVTGNNFEATFAGQAVTAVKGAENIIMFQVPASASPGEHRFKIPALNIDLLYKVEATSLTGTPEAEMAAYFSNISQAAQTLEQEGTPEAQRVLDAITAFNQYYETLTDAEKTAVAVYYKANKQRLNEFSSYSNNLGRTGSAQFDLDYFVQYKASVFVFGLSVGVAVLCPEPATRAVAAVAAFISWKESKGYLQQIMEAKLKKVNIAVDNLLSDLGRTNNNSLIFTSGEEKTLVLEASSRSIQANDEENEIEYFNIFFTSFDAYDTAIASLNQVINFVNDNLFFSNIDTLPEDSVPANQPTETETATQDLFNNIQFTVTDSNVQLSNVSYADGNITLTLTVPNPEAVSGESVATTLNYTYEDELNSFNGYFSILVNTTDCSASNLAATATATGNSATATATGGEPPYVYEWSNGSTGASVSGLEPGSYTVTVTDGNGCTATNTINIEEVDPCEYNNAPVILNINKVCLESNASNLYFDIDFSADGAGFNPTGSYSGVPTPESYPVWLEFKQTESSPWQEAANSYSAFLLSGDYNQGTIRFVFPLDIVVSTAKCDYYNGSAFYQWYNAWRIKLIDSCGDESEWSSDLHIEYWAS